MVVLGYPMLHTKFQSYCSTGSGEEEFLKVFTIYGHGGHIGNVTFIPSAQVAGGHLYGKQLFTWLSLVVSLIASFVLSFFPTRCLG